MECIECRNCHQIFNSNTTQAHCFPCGHLLCLKCIKQLKTLGCPLNCLLPANHIWLPPCNASDFSQLNTSIVQRVCIDFTGIANLQHRVTEREQELMDTQSKLTEKENIIRQMHEYTTACMLLLGLPGDEVVRGNHETREALTDGFTVKLDIPSSTKIKPLSTPEERVSVAIWADAAASSSSRHATWGIRPVQVVPSLPIASTLLQAGPQLQPPTPHAQRSTLANVLVRNARSSAQTHRSLQPQSTMQGQVFGTSSVQPGVLREAGPPEDMAPQSQGSTSSGMTPSPPSPIHLRPLTNAERAFLCDGEPYPGAETPSPGSKAPGMSGSFQSHFGSPAPASSTPPPPAQPGTTSRVGPSAQGRRAWDQNAAKNPHNTSLRGRMK